MGRSRGDTREALGALRDECARAGRDARLRARHAGRRLAVGADVAVRAVAAAGRAVLLLLGLLWLLVERAYLAFEGALVATARLLARGARAAPRALRPRRRRRRAWAVLGGGVGVVVLGSAGAFGFLYARTEVPDAVALRPTVVVDVRGREIGTLRAEAYEPIEAERLPEHVTRAVMAAEDRGFLHHPGVSPTGTVRALWTNLTAGRVEQGGSTITQQYVGELVTDEDPSYRDKLEEALISLKLERMTDKTEILERYLNTVYFGRGAYGIGAAARTYFGKAAADLTVNEAATLAGMIVSPGQLDPGERPGAVDRRRVYTLRGMAEEGWLPGDDADRLVAAGLPETRRGRAIAHDVGAYYLEAVRREVASLLGDEAVLTGHRVVVDMDLALQRHAEEVVAAHTGDEPFSGALVAIDPRDGGVRALVGGPDFRSQPLNVAVASRRQPGSAFKPFTLAAFVEDGFSPESRFDAPSEVDVDTATGEHTVHNYGEAAYGIQTVREATETSTNTVYAQLVEEVDPSAVVDVARRAGIRSELPAVPSITLGTGGVTPLELTSAYATLANDGVRTSPRIVQRIERYDGEVVLDREPHRERAVDEETARVVSDVLTGVVEDGTGTAADLDRPVAGKTGTTDDNRDAWFVGYVPQLVAGVWIGNLDNAPTDGVTGGEVPAALWEEFVSRALDGVPVEEFPEPEFDGLDVLVEARPPPPPPPEGEDEGRADEEDEEKEQKEEEKQQKEQKEDE